jgi:uncharacterized peroxidase-related enzyme
VNTVTDTRAEAARVPLIEPAEAGPELAALYREIEGQFGGLPNLFKALGHRPAILRATLDKVAAVMQGGELDRRLKEMVAVVVADARGCAYCVGAHSMVLRRLGVPEETIALLDGDLARSDLPASWIGVLELARAAARDVHGITDARFGELSAQGLSDAAIVELASVMDLFMSLSFFLDLLAVPLDQL